MRRTISYLLTGWGLPTLRAWRTHPKLIARIYLTWLEVTSMCALDTIVTTPTIFDRASAFPPSTGRPRARTPRIRNITTDDAGALVIEIEPTAKVTEKRLASALCTFAYEWNVPEERLSCGTTGAGARYLRVDTPVTLTKGQDR
ncbi:hypothetical protein [Nocardia sp. NPDC051832]|uniref:hypothetical protein n=1 Tax=Nocardia sp. NPDC051832 TaxID=3155673 RepID=UPI003445762A